MITATILGGDCYPATPIGINLPNADWIRKDYGSKSVTIENITHAYNEAAKGNGFLEEFIYDPADIELQKRYGELSDNLHTDLHECLGHGSGQLAPGVKTDALKNYGSTSKRLGPICLPFTIWEIRSWLNWDSFHRSMRQKLNICTISSTV